MDFILSSPRKRKRESESISAKAIEYFKRIETNSQSGDVSSPRKKTHICNLCKSECNGSSKWNLAAHLAHCHHEIYSKISEKQDSLPIKRLKVLQNCTETVSVNGRPFEWLHDSGYRKQIQGTLDELAAANLALNLSDHNLTVVKEHLSKMAKNVREKIKAEVKDRPLSLLVDIGTKNKRSILGVSLQYLLVGEVKVRSIGFIELLDRHTGIYLANVIIKRLEELNIKLIQIFSMTTDNGKNVLKLVREMETCLQTEIDKMQQQAKETTKVTSSENSNVHNHDENLDDAIIDLLAQYTKASEEDADALENAMDEVPLDCHKTLLEVMTTELIKNDTNILWNITGIRCAAHSLQLGVNDALKLLATSVVNVISLCRELCKFLRLQSTINDMMQIGLSYRLPRIEVKTRWSSTYLMVNYLLNHFNYLNLL